MRSWQVAGVADGGEQGSEMFGAARFQRNVNGRFAKADAVVAAVEQQLQ